MSYSIDDASRVCFGQAVFDAFNPRDPSQRVKASAFRDELFEAGYQQAASAFNVQRLDQIPPGRELYLDKYLLPRNALGYLCRLFLLNVVVSARVTKSLFSRQTRRFLIDLGILIRRPGGWQSQVSIFPVERAFIATDVWRYDAIWPANKRSMDRVMYVGSDSVGLALVASRRPAESTLDLCCGSGIQTLVAATYSRRAIGVDINPRALRFAVFNAAMNAVENAEFLCGDLWAPVKGGRFDAILANPPFVPLPVNAAPLLFRDGGPQGEQVLQRVLVGAVEYGDARLSVATDLINLAELAQRVQHWQGKKRQTTVLVEAEADLLSYAEAHTNFHDGKQAHIEAALLMYDHMIANRVRSLHFGYVLQSGNDGDCSVNYLREEPRRYIGDEIEEWSWQQELCARGLSDDMMLAAREGTRTLLAIVRDRMGDRLREIEVESDSGFLPRIQISGEVSRLIYELSGQSRSYGEVCKEYDREVVGELMRAGYVFVLPEHDSRRSA